MDLTHDDAELLAGRYEIEERAFGAGAERAYGKLAAEPGATYFTVTIVTPSGRGRCAALDGKRYRTRGGAQAAVDRHVENLRGLASEVASA
jgi:hypothetical protein